MIFKITVASDYRGWKDQTRDIRSLKGLQDLAKEHRGWHGEDQADLIVSFKDKMIIVYDTYVE